MQQDDFYEATPLETAPQPITKTRLLADANQAVSGDRQKRYGHPSVNFQRTVDLWNAYLIGRGLIEPNKPLFAYDFALMMDLVKTARLMHDPTHVDSWQDKAGYSATGAEVATARDGW